MPIITTSNLDRQRSAIDEAEKELAEIKRDIDHHHRKLDDLEQEYADKRKEINNLENDLEDMEEEFEHADERITEVLPTLADAVALDDELDRLEEGTEAWFRWQRIRYDNPTLLQKYQVLHPEFE